ncbi:MAG: hypothetical protein Q8811_00795 [Candidatus Phytoplasma australasiaticum]|nr:hypothetical protein [Candidatus Phytoplasma australasiaticum]
MSEHRYEMMTTVFLIIFIYSGFKPLFYFLNNIIFFVKDLIVDLFFKTKKQVLLEQKRMKKEMQHQKLVLKGEQNYQESHCSPFTTQPNEDVTVITWNKK